MLRDTRFRILLGLIIAFVIFDGVFLGRLLILQARAGDSSMNPAGLGTVTANPSATAGLSAVDLEKKAGADSASVVDNQSSNLGAIPTKASSDQRFAFFQRFFG